ncbi:hypothetical protein IE81DRAFT_356253 [Ceraceosorus guamensis]|uniref:Uncharacterized protein n=1 Tax=Ceraceosorus guamensis TaxID=1522189 RepID=A0A316VZ43_9BASI|nr:hypothetical protein IE81DRAFT_356253 [Ceraceosorus guamensis]PWN42722.1 hypothetical protein IE81DRAFT_356253 [Ceraceosorus guamensis]
MTRQSRIRSSFRQPTLVVVLLCLAALLAMTSSTTAIPVPSFGYLREQAMDKVDALFNRQPASLCEHHKHKVKNGFSESRHCETSTKTAHGKSWSTTTSTRFESSTTSGSGNGSGVKGKSHLASYSGPLKFSHSPDGLHHSSWLNFDI